ncbi:hypothetical protein HK100_002949 [Physocladia obscura]|uniref:Uncharacterized protein n=1 Tax=Physocladia obscura TaxID=109957 RepID=A0AAD5SUM8_9FUNG|nr:hypothetical protein HK100_002949 [Physocladia obscura]
MSRMALRAHVRGATDIPPRTLVDIPLRTLAVGDNLFNTRKTTGGNRSKNIIQYNKPESNVENTINNQIHEGNDVLLSDENITLSKSLPNQSQPTFRSQWELFGSKNPEQNYTFNPPAAPKYFLWDNTPVGHTIPVDTSRLAIASIRVHTCAHRALLDSCKLLPRSSGLIIGFLLGRIISSDILGTDLSLSRARRNDFIISPHDGSVILKQVLVLDRFDAGRRQNSDNRIKPTVLLDGDVCVKVFSKDNGQYDFSEAKYIELMKEMDKDIDLNDTFPLALQFNSDNCSIEGAKESRFALYGNVGLVYELQLDKKEEERSIQDDIVCLIDMVGLDIHKEEGFLNALETVYQLKLTQPPSTRLKIKQSENIEHAELFCGTETSEKETEYAKQISIIKENQVDSNDQQNTSNSNDQKITFSPAASISQDPAKISNSESVSPQISQQQQPIMDPTQFIQQQQNQMYMMLMQRQYEMLVALTNSKPPVIATATTSPILQSFIPPPVFGVPTLYSVPHNFTELEKRDKSSSPKRSEASSNSPPNSTSTFGTQTVTTCSVGTNTSLVFDESHFRKSKGPVFTKSENTVIESSLPINSVQKNSTLSTPNPYTDAMTTYENLEIESLQIQNISTAAKAVTGLALSMATSLNVSMISDQQQKQQRQVNSQVAKKKIIAKTPPQQLQQQEHNNSNLPPIDTGSNYKPLYTFESIPVQVLEESQQHQQLRGCPKVTGLEHTSVHASEKRLSSRVCGGNSNAQRWAVMSMVPQQHSYLSNGCAGVAAVNATKNMHVSMIGSVVSASHTGGMLSLDISGIEGNEIIGEESAYEEYAGVVEEIGNERCESNGGIEDIEDEERTRELIARLVDHVEQSFIFRETDHNEWDGSRNFGKLKGDVDRRVEKSEVSKSYGFKERLYQSDWYAHTELDAVDEMTTEESFGNRGCYDDFGHGEYVIGSKQQNQKRYDGATKAGQDSNFGQPYSEASTTRDQFSKATLEYLTKFGLL